MEWQLENMAVKTVATTIHLQAKEVRIPFCHQVSAVSVSLVLHNWCPIISHVELIIILPWNKSVDHIVQDYLPEQYIYLYHPYNS